MTPLQIEILLHYYARADDYRGGDFTDPAVGEALNMFRSRGLLSLEPEYGSRNDRSYHPTEGLKLYVETLCSVPLPVKKWVMPSIDQESRLKLSDFVEHFGGEK